MGRGRSQEHPNRIGWLDGVPRDEKRLLEFSGVEILQRDRQRLVLRIPAAPSRPALIAKIHRERDLAARLRRKLGWGRARLEWHNLMHAEAGGASVPRPVALVTHRDHDIVFLEYLLDTELFPQHLERYEGAPRRAMLRRLGDWVAEVMRAGVDARDLHPGTILVRGYSADLASLWLIDLHDAWVGHGVPDHRRTAIVRQVAAALGAARAGEDVRHFLEGWCEGARNRGLDASWAVGPARQDDGIGWAQIEPRRLQETLEAAEKSEIERRRRHISRALRRGEHHNSIPVRDVMEVRRGAGPRNAPSSHGPRAAWFGDRILQTVWHQRPQAALFIPGGVGKADHVVECAPRGESLASCLAAEPQRKPSVRGAAIIDAVLSTMARYHHEGIQLVGADPHHWFIEEQRDGIVALPDRACIRYPGRLTAGMRLADLLQLAAIFDGTVTPWHRLRVLRSHPEFGRLALHRPALRSLAWHLGDLFATSSSRRREVVKVRPVTDIDAEVSALHRLNQAHVPELGGLDATGFDALLRGASFLRVVDGEDADSPSAMLVGMLPDDDYDSPNFRWFCRGFENFAYVDRIATAAQARRRGVGSALYAVMEAWARRRGLSSMVCEVNLQPRNQDSIDFHHAYGFREVGQYIGRGKPVMMMQKQLQD